jgi:signal transduction histidine kinase
MESPQPVRILVVDDEPAKLLALRAVLEGLCGEVVCVGSGREALRRLMTDEFALILLDVNMPDVDGFETAALVRQRKSCEHIPIIFVTSYHDEARALQSYELGAVDYIMTPVVPQVLRAKVQVFVDLFLMQQEVRRQAISHVRLAEEQAARAAAERSNHAKGEFLANVSHELRTPMNAIIGMTELALAEPISPDAREYLTTSRASAYSLLGLLNEILDFSRMESGKFTLEPAPFDLREVVHLTTKSLAVRAFEKRLELICNLPDSLPPCVIGDSLRVRQVLMNLLGNAIKFTHAGGVALSMTDESTTETHLDLRICVRDTGIGISAADQQRIFSPFTQADASMTRLYGGTGLGLAIASDLIHKMDGRIWVESAVDQGSAFWFLLRMPVGEDAAATPRGAAPEFPAGLPVTVIDGVPLHRDIVCEMLRAWGLRPIPFADAESCREWRLSQGGPPAAVAVASVGIHAEGPQAWVEPLLQDDVVQSVLLLVSAADRQAAASWLRHADSVYCQEKPVLPRELAQTLALALSGRNPLAEAPAPAPVRVSNGRNLRILVAEDLPANQKLLQIVLCKRGHEVFVAGDGCEAVELARRHDLDVILMDVQMPRMDGIQATAEIRGIQESDRQRVPIIAMTAHAMEGDRERFLAAGMDGYVAKPINVPELLEYLEHKLPVAMVGAALAGDSL